MTIIEDPNADARSLMYRAPCICNGEKTGVQCKHFWGFFKKFAAANADTVRDGEKQRSCTLVPGWPLEFVDEEKPTRCNRFEPRKEPGLVAITKRAAVRLVGGKEGPGYVRFDDSFERFNPMTEEDIKKLREEFPDRPVVGRFTMGKNPMSMTPDDIINGPQIGIVKPGESAPSSELSEETSRAVDGLFGSGDDGIFKK